MLNSAVKRTREIALRHLFLRLPLRLTALSRAPLIGPLLHSLSRALLPSPTRVCVRVRKGAAKDLWMSVNPRTGRELYEGTHEPMVQETLTEHLEPAMVLYDLGANAGLFTLIGARCVGTGGKVYAFEPDPDLCQRLSENVSRNGFSNVEIVQAAVCSTTGSVDFVPVDPSVSPDLGLGRMGAGLPGSSVIRVRSVALDDFVQGAAAPDVVKCDVEGAEMEVLEGAHSVLQRKR